jgi:hypothetical protein
MDHVFIDVTAPGIRVFSVAEFRREMESMTIDEWRKEHSVPEPQHFNVPIILIPAPDEQNEETPATAGAL